MEKKNISVEKITETLGDAVKLAATLSEATKKDSNMQRLSDDSNNNQSNPNQQVQIHIGEQERNKDKEKEKPIIIHEKPETHIHKDFPDDRPLSDKECDLALEKAKMDNALKNKELEYKQYREEQERRDRRLREEVERKEKEAQRVKNEKKAKVRGIIASALGIIGAIGVGYSIYRDNRNKGTDMANSTVINGEGKVE